MCQALVTLDTVNRRRKRWPLVGAAEINGLKAVFGDGNPSIADDLHKVWTAWCVTGRLFDRHSHFQAVTWWGRKGGTDPTSSKDVGLHLAHAFPGLAKIWELGGENVVVAGGAVVKAVQCGYFMGVPSRAWEW
jgi:hypothetical protein